MDIIFLFDHLDEVLLLAQLQNFGETAEQLYISQSTLSKHIRKIEAKLGGPLFDRTTRKVSLNAFGQAILPQIAKLKAARDDLTDTIQQHQKKKTTQIAVSAIPLLDVYEFPQILARFQNAYPEYSFQITENYDTTPLDDLRTGKSDLSFFRTSLDIPEDLCCIPYAKDSIVAVLSINHRYARMHSIPLGSLCNDDFALISPKTSIYNLCMEACKAGGFVPSVIYTSHRIESIVNMVEQSMCVALLTRQQAMLVWRPTLSIVELNPNIETGIALYYKPDSVSDAAKKFLSFLHEQKNLQK